jgi:hypothetical protein
MYFHLSINLLTSPIMGCLPLASLSGVFLPVLFCRYISGSFTHLTSGLLLFLSGGVHSSKCLAISCPQCYIRRTRTNSNVGRDSSVVIALATGWTVRGSNPGGGEILRTRPDRPWGPPSLLYNRYRVIPGDKAAGAWRWPPTPIYRRG